MREHTGSVVRGEFEYEGSSSITASTCQVPEKPQFMGSVDEVTGSPSSFSGRQVVPNPGAAGSGEQVVSFQGSINGNTVTGSFRFEETNVAAVLPLGETQVGVGTFTLTLQKQ